MIAIPDLGRKIEETLFDAVNYFGKKCPYCQKDLYDGNIRNRIETDHYIPIALGGQHVPWNVLPSCRKCNRKKKDLHPIDFLDIQVREKCEAFLAEIRENISGRVQIDLDAAQQAKHYIEDKLQKVISPEARAILVDLSRIFQLNLEVDTFAPLFQRPSNSIEQFIEVRCVFWSRNSISKKDIYQQYKNFCASGNMYVESKEQFFKNLFSATNDVSSFRPTVNGNREWWVKGITLRI